MEQKQNQTPYNLLVACISAFNVVIFAYKRATYSDFNDNILEHVVWIVWLENGEKMLFKIVLHNWQKVHFCVL